MAHRRKYMKKLRYIRGAALALALAFSANTVLCLIKPPMVSYAYTPRSASVNASNLNVRSGPGTSYSSVAKLSKGTAITVIGEKNASDGALWYEIRFSASNGAEKTGYVLNSYVKFPVTYTSDQDFEAYLTNQGFPESYKNGLRQLHAQYPQWVFTAQHTNLEWETVIQNEAVVGRNLVHKDSISSWKSIADGAYNWDSSSWPGFDTSSWVAASEGIIRYYMDPRNFLDETYVFQFLSQSYDASAHTKEGLELMVAGTFLSGTASAGSGNPGNSGNSGNSGGSSYGPGGSSSSGGGQSSSGSSYGPGISPGASGSPGTSGSSGTVSGSSGQDGVRFEEPTKGNNSDISLGPPHASISRKYVDVVTTSIGPGMSPGMGSSSPGSGGSGPGGSGDNSGSGSPPSSGSNSYVDIIMNAGAQSGVNPYVLAAMIIQEQGKGGTSDSISGRCSGYEGYYNFFNIEAYASGSMTPVQRGLWYASQSGNYGRPWNSPEAAILGGSTYYGNNYVKVGQDTFYLKKFNVQGSNLYKHQYMTNVQGAASEAALYASAYSSELKKSALEFKIPVFKNMPEQASAKPNVDGSPNNKLSGLGVNGFTLTPTFNKDTTEYDLIVSPSVSQITVNAVAIHSAASISGSGTIQLQAGNNDIRITVTAQNGTVREYIIRVVRQDGGPTGDGSVNNGVSDPSGGPGASSGPGPGSGSGTPTGNTPGGSDVVVISPAG